ncbi:hypothetical protein Goarm_004956, partial [Gossypium armourianum]|nr:hypothetical protein [Gossypium armourianum]
PFSSHHQPTLTTSPPIFKLIHRKVFFLESKSNHNFSRKKSPVEFKLINKRQSESMVTKPLGKNLVMGQVKILKRSKLLVTTVEKTDR